jgi:predicted amidohydrolase
VRTIDAAGATVLPGLIDAHVHLESVPGSYYRDDKDDALWAFRVQQLKAYPACGVTTVLDNAISARQLREFQEYMKNGGVGPRIFALAPLFFPPGGYGDRVKMRQWGPFPACGTPEDIESLFEAYAELDDIIGVKMTLEPGMGPFRVWPIHGPEMRDAIAAAARQRGLPIHVHVLRLEEQQMALEMGAYCLVHPGFFRSAPPLSRLSMR